jgi:acyl-homoserine lactone synthase
MQVHIVTAANRHQYLDEIERMHRHRHRLFVEVMGWKALESPDRLDIDEFDNANATYLIALDNGIVRGSARFTPTWRPNMLKNLFPEFVDGEPPCGPGIWEWTRQAPGDPDWPREFNQLIRTLLHISIHEFAVSRGIDRYTGIADTRIIPKMIDLGWRVDPIGLPRNYGEGTAYAFVSPVEAANIDRLRARIRRTDPILVEMPRGLSTSEGRLARRSVELAMQLPPGKLERAEEALRALVELQG